MKHLFIGGFGSLLAIAGCSSDSAGTSKACSDVSGDACNWAGVLGSQGFNGDGLDKQESWFYFPADLTFAPDGAAWVVDWNNHLIRRIGDDNKMVTMVGTDYEGDGSPGETDRLPAGAPAGALGTEVALNHPTDVEFFPDGRVAIAAWHNNKIRVYDPTTKILKVLAGNSYGFAGDNGPATGGVFNQPKTVAIDPAGNLYTIDQRNQRVRRISNDATPMITTIMGDGMKGMIGDGGPALTAELHMDAGTTPTPSGSLTLRGDELFFADTLNQRIRRINLTTQIVDCIAGCADAVVIGYAGDGGSARTATFNFPMDIEFGPDGRLYVADRLNNAIRAIDIAGDKIETVVGNGQACTASPCIEAKIGTALDLQFNQPYGIAFDAPGNMYVADTLNNRIVRIAK